MWKHETEKIKPNAQQQLHKMQGFSGIAVSQEFLSLKENINSEVQKHSICLTLAELL
jgi:hypothetical protein